MTHDRRRRVDKYVFRVPSLFAGPRQKARWPTKSGDFTEHLERDAYQSTGVAAESGVGCCGTNCHGGEARAR